MAVWDVREVLYGKSCDYLAVECLAANHFGARDRTATIHAKTGTAAPLWIHYQVAG